MDAREIVEKAIDRDPEIERESTEPYDFLGNGYYVKRRVINQIIQAPTVPTCSPFLMMCRCHPLLSIYKMSDSPPRMGGPPAIVFRESRWADNRAEKITSVWLGQCAECKVIWWQAKTN